MANVQHGKPLPRFTGLCLQATLLSMLSDLITFYGKGAVENIHAIWLQIIFYELKKNWQAFLNER